MTIIQQYTTKNPCYKNANKINVKGLMLHSVGCPQPKAQVFVNNFNSSSACTAVHAFIDANDGTVYQTLPWDYKAWHCGVRTKGGPSANATHIGIELCEPKQIKYTAGSRFTYTDKNLPEAKKAVETTYKSAVLLFSKLCNDYNLDPLKDGVIISHKEGYDRGIASGHADVNHLWEGLKIGYTMDGFRKDVKAELTKEPSISIVKMESFRVQTIGGGANIYKTPGVTTEGRHPKPTGAGVFTIVEVTDDNWGLLKAYEKGRNGWIYLSNPYVTRV